MTVPLIGLAHGSRHPAGSAAIEDLLAETARLGAIETHPAYLDLAAPDLATAADALATAGHSRAVVLPLLFTAAYHATIDTPEAVRDAAARSGVELVMADILGTGDDVVELLRAGLADAGVGSEVSVLLVAVGSSTPAANAGRRRSGRTAGEHPRSPGTGGVRHLRPAPGDGRRRTWTSRSRSSRCSWPTDLLLDPVRALAAERGWTMAEPLGAGRRCRLARYRSPLEFSPVALLDRF